ncbi:MAG: glycosyltransferase [Ktedonobacterales bacterium]
MLIYQSVITAVLAALLLNTLNNLRLLHRPPIRPAPADGPLVSILVPARNEARSIARCVISLARQTYPRCEVLVLDDESEDATASIVGRLAQRYANVRLLRGAPLPPGWHGKAWACQQLGLEARGEWLLFVDADTVLVRECVATTLETAQARRADLLTLIPWLETGSIGEALLVATQPQTFAGLLPQGLVMSQRWPGVAGALGKFLLFRRETYLRCGGHEAVRADIVEDLALGRVVKRYHGRLVWIDGTALVRARPYAGLREAWRGIGKGSFAAINYSLAAMVPGLAFVAAVMLAPYGFAIAGIVTGVSTGQADAALLWLPLAQVALLMVSFALIVWRFKLPRSILFLQAAMTLTTILVTLDSAYHVTRGDGVAWKGRTYRFGGARRTGRRAWVVAALAAVRLAIVVVLVPLGWQWGQAELSLAAILTLVAGTCAVLEYTGARDRRSRLTPVADVGWCAAALIYLQLDALLPLGMVVVAALVALAGTLLLSWRAGVVSAGALLGGTVVLAAGMAMPQLDAVALVWALWALVLSRRAMAHLVGPWLERFHSP